MQLVRVVQTVKGGVDALGLKVAEEGGGDRSHSLDVATIWTPEEGVQDMEKGTLASNKGYLLGLGNGRALRPTLHHNACKT